MKTIWAAIQPVLHAGLRPIRALILAYRHVLRGDKVTTPYEWKDI